MYLSSNSTFASKQHNTSNQSLIHYQTFPNKQHSFNHAHHNNSSCSLNTPKQPISQQHKACNQYLKYYPKFQNTRLFRSYTPQQFIVSTQSNEKSLHQHMPTQHCIKLTANKSRHNTTDYLIPQYKSFTHYHLLYNPNHITKYLQISFTIHLQNETTLKPSTSQKHLHSAPSLTQKPHFKTHINCLSNLPYTSIY